MSEKLELLLEAERRGILPPDKAELLGEARKRGLVPALEGAPKAAGPSSMAEAYKMRGARAGTIASNIPGSALNFARDVATPFMEPKETGKALLKLGQGAVHKVIPGYHPSEEAANAVGRFFKDRYGGLDKIRKTVETDPVGALADVAGATSLLGAAVRGPGIIGKTGKVLRTVGREIDPTTIVGRTAGKVGNLGTRLGQHGVQMLGGGSVDALKIAAESGREGAESARAFLKGMRNPDVGMETVNKLKDALGKMRSDMSSRYQAGMLGVGQDATVLNFDAIDDALKQSRKVKTFRGRNISKSTAKVMDEIETEIMEWRALDPSEYHTPAGLDALKQSIWDISRQYEHGTPARTAADNIYHAIKDTIVDQAPKYADIMDDYSRSADLINDIEKSLSAGKKAAASTTFRKLLSVTRNNVNTNYGERLGHIRTVEDATGVKLRAPLAGLGQSSWLPRGMAGNVTQGAALGTAGGLLSPKLVGLAPFMSPRIMGEAAYYGGKALEKTRPIVPHVRPATSLLFQTGRLQDIVE